MFIASGTQCRAHSYTMQRPLPEGRGVMAFAQISSNKPHARTRAHTPPVTRGAATRARCCLLPSPPASSSPLLLDPPPTPFRTISPPLHHRHKHLRLLTGCLLLCVSKRFFVGLRSLCRWLVKPHFDAELEEKGAFLRARTHTQTHTQGKCNCSVGSKP